MQPFRADRSHGIGPGGHLVEVAAPQRPAHGPGEDQRSRLRLDKDRQVLAQRRDDRAWDTYDSAAGSPSRISPVDRSTNAARTRTVPASRSRSQRRSAVARPSAGWRTWRGEPGRGTADRGCSRPGHRRPSSRAPVLPGPGAEDPPVLSASRRVAGSGAGIRPPGACGRCRPGDGRRARPARRPEPRTAPAVPRPPRPPRRGYSTGSGPGSCRPRPPSSGPPGAAGMPWQRPRPTLRYRVMSPAIAGSSACTACQGGSAALGRWPGVSAALWLEAPLARARLRSRLLDDQPCEVGPSYLALGRLPRRLILLVATAASRARFARRCAIGVCRTLDPTTAHKVSAAMRKMPTG